MAKIDILNWHEYREVRHKIVYKNGCVFKTELKGYCHVSRPVQTGEKYYTLPLEMATGTEIQLLGDD